MIQKLKAVYRGGAFFPSDVFSLPEETEVELTVESSLVIEPIVKDRAERQRRLQRLTERMQHNPIPQVAPKFTREELHERG